ncbi:sulfonate transport system ATP-binding protein [Nocardioides zeae]|uniref:Sulfonate transport system ATP-binding protein n=1 Tax=Nocardioides zeae TaxID=1457234 RepID=A0ACC6IFA7_9ACTN|nr:ABC transporter ATP-binding protein [Nocardioides zeae]MDR6174895.1 sulfonate transport system ATP-binding protein [Nocardioides zeae]MDR6209295.1 sulfonate transport system ATP-binding protein [Nocardioides zeae]
MAAISFAGVHRRFGATTVLDGVDLEVDPGEFVAVVGRSGTGKSTLLRLVAGLDRPDAGTVRATGAVAVAFQEPRLMPWLPVRTNVTLGLGRGRRGDARTALEEVGLGERGNAWPLELSGGQAQRVSLARALVRRPDVLLLDEPFGALDALTRLEMQRLVGGLWRSHGFTAVMVTHDVDEAVRLADRVIVLGGGRIEDELRVPGRGPRTPDDPALAPFATRLLGALGALAPHEERTLA